MRRRLFRRRPESASYSPFSRRPDRKLRPAGGAWRARSAQRRSRPCRAGVAPGKEAASLRASRRKLDENPSPRPAGHAAHARPRLPYCSTGKLAMAGAFAHSARDGAEGGNPRRFKSHAVKSSTNYRRGRRRRPSRRGHSPTGPGGREDSATADLALQSSMAAAEEARAPQARAARRRVSMRMRASSRRQRLASLPIRLNASLDPRAPAPGVGLGFHRDEFGDCARACRSASRFAYYSANCAPPRPSTRRAGLRPRRRPRRAARPRWSALGRTSRTRSAAGGDGGRRVRSSSSCPAATPVS